MKPLARVLAATDLSAPARHAVARAFRLAAETGAELTLLHVLSQTAMDQLRALLGASSATVEQRLVDAARAHLATLAAELGQAHRVSAGTRIIAGRVLSAILEEADALDAGLLVVGARGEDFLGRLLLGTTAERLLRRTLRPMLVVKQPPREAYRRVLVPVDFSPFALRALGLARAVAPGAELVLFHAYEAPFESKLRFAGVEEETLNRYLIAARAEALARLRALAEEAGLKPGEARLDVRHGDAARVIVTQEQELDCDLTVLGKHGQGMMEELLLGSVTKHILAESMGDVLVVCG
ncbi:MAG: universal stress protein [Thiobacillaceae bacterium]|jgi:nucleotide-binding universal stress UspA family protein|nr:universal stress protein [Thiobacillaceae bacterium]